MTEEEFKTTQARLDEYSEIRRVKTRLVTLRDAIKSRDDWRISFIFEGNSASNTDSRDLLDQRDLKTLLLGTFNSRLKFLDKQLEEIQLPTPASLEQEDSEESTPLTK